MKGQSHLCNTAAALTLHSLSKGGTRSIVRFSEIADFNQGGNKMLLKRYQKRTVQILLVLVLTVLWIVPAGARGFTHAPVIVVDGEDYYLAGAPDGPDGATDIPGHYWIQAGRNKLVGKHYNTGPFEAPSWWSSDAPDGAFLYKVQGRIDTWSEQRAERYARGGFVHYHELLSADDGSLHPTKIVWLKHIAVSSFTLDGGPHPELAHDVTPGVDLEFIPNGSTPYNP
jgi:hypothetical protein